MNNYTPKNWIEEMDKFLEAYHLPKLNQKETKHLNRPITNKEIESVIQNLPTKKTLEPDGFTAEICEIFKEESMIFLLNLFPKKLKRSKHFQAYFMRQALPWNQSKRSYKKIKLKANIPDGYRRKILKKILANWIWQHIKRIICHN